MIVAIRQPLLVALSLAAAGAAFASLAAPAAADVPPCAASALRLRVEAGGARFRGMSHDGAIAIVRNAGTVACALPALPNLVALDASGAAVARGVPPGARFMHPGPVVFPLVLRPGAVAAGRFNWITGDVFGGDPAHGVTSASLAITVGGGTLKAPFVATMWGRTNAPVTFGENRFTTDRRTR